MRAETNQHFWNNNNLYAYHYRSIWRPVAITGPISIAVAAMRLTNSNEATAAEIIFQQ